MNLMQMVTDTLTRIAEDHSKGRQIDKHWKSVLPEVQDIIQHEIFLTIHRQYINEPMKCRAAEIAQTIQPRDISDLDDATLVLHCSTRRVWLGIGDEPEFQAIVDSKVKGLIYSPDPICWVNPYGVWLPLSEGTARQIESSLIERYKQGCFAQHCWTELLRRNPRNEAQKYAFTLLTDCDEFHHERNESDQWLRKESRRIDPDVGEDAMHDWLDKLLDLPLHIQMTKSGATLKAIRDRSIDMRRKGGGYEHVALDEFADTIPDQSLEAPDQELLDNEYIENLLANRKQIEEILTRKTARARKAKIGKRRFEVLQMLAHTPDLTSSELANLFGMSEQTIGRDRVVIGESWPQIRKVLNS
jgi:hypothetical protein